MHTQRQDGRHGGRVPSKKQKAKIAILKNYPLTDCMAANEVLSVVV